MDFALSRRDRWLVSAGAVVVSLALIYQAGRIWRASYLLHSGEPDKLVRAVALEPGNGEAWDRLGRYQQLLAEPPQVERSIQSYEHAVSADPRSARYWSDLASAYEESGQTRRAEAAYLKALAAYPGSAEIQFDYGNFLLRQSRFPEAFQAMRRASETDPSLLSLIITRGWGAEHDANVLLNQILPPTATAYLAALDFLSDSQQGEAALIVWERLLTLHEPFALGRIFRFVDELLREERSQDAEKVWFAAHRALGLPLAAGSDRDVVWNGGFEYDLAGGGLDWRFSQRPGIEVGLDTSVRHSGQRSLRMDFAGGENYQISEPYQVVCVEPERSYEFRAYVRTADLTTESGIHFVLFDPHHTEIPAIGTADLVGTHDWTRLEATYKTGPQTHLLRIEIQRLSSRLFENRLGGTVWVDDVSLVPVEETRRQASP